MVITREEFTEDIIKPLFPNNPGMAGPDSGLWVPEYDGVFCKWFVRVAPVKVSSSANRKKTFWNWCNKNLKGTTRCFMSDPDNKAEWWGFTHKEDIPLWLLKWSN